MKVRLWVMGARPRTLTAAMIPVVVGAAAVVGEGGVGADVGSGTPWWRVGPAMTVAVALQVAVNYLNDYSDGVRGTDRTDMRVGPTRLVGSGLVPPVQVKAAAVVACAVAGMAGLVLAAVAGWWLVLVGAVCVVVAWGYTGGPRPYGYIGWGEVSVFVFFGLVATVGTAYVLVERVEWLFVVVAVPVGLWAVALLVVNNLRDIDGDKVAGKLTLAVRIGDRRTRALYVTLIVVSYIAAVATVLWGRAGWGALLGLPSAVVAILALRRANTPEALIGMLGATSRMQLVSGLGLAGGLALG